MGLLITVNLIAWNVYGSTNAPPKRGFSFIELWMTGVQSTILLAILGMTLLTHSAVNALGNSDFPQKCFI